MEGPSHRYRRFELVINVSIAVIVALTAALIIQRLVWPRVARQASSAASRPTIPAPGSTVALPGGLASPRTLLIAVRKGCPACDSDAPSLRELKARAEVQKVPVRLLVPNEETMDDGYLRLFDGSTADATLVSFAEMGIGAVPAVIEVDAKGVVTRSWMGRIQKQLPQWQF